MSKKGDKRKQLQTRRIGRPETSAKADLSKYEDLIGKGTGIFGGQGLDLTGKVGEDGIPRFSAGGVSDMNLLQRAAMGVRQYYTPEEKAWIAAREAEYADYNKAVEKYNQDVSAYQKKVDEYNESIKPYQSEVDAYNKALEEYNKGVEAYRKSLYLDPEGTTARIYEKTGGKGWSGRVRDPATGTVYEPGQYYFTEKDGVLYARQNPTNVVDLERRLVGRGAFEFIDPRTKKVVGTGGLSGYPTAHGQDYFVYGGKLYEFAKAPGEFTAKLPGNPPPAFTGVQPTAPTNVPYTQEQVKEYVDKAKVRAQQSAANRSSALSVAANPEQYGLSGFGLSLPFKEGGEVSNDEFIKQMTVGTLPKDQGPSPADVKVSQALRALGELTRGTLGAEAIEPGSEAYRTGQALSNMPGVGVAAGAIKGSKKLTDLEKYLNNMLGAEQAKRIQRAADEIPNLENQYSAEALLRAFRGGKGEPYQGVITLDPAMFEKFASPLNEPLTKGSKENIEKLQWVLRDKKGFNEVPMLLLNKEGERLPFITGHEGRHRSRALAAEGMPTTLVEIIPNRNLEFPGPGMEKRTAQDWREILNKTLDEGSRLVRAETKSRLNPEVEALMEQIQKLESQSNPDWEKISQLRQELDLWKKSDNYIVQDPTSFQKLPEVYKDGGPVKRQAGSPPTGEVSTDDFIQQTLVGTPPGIMAQASQEPGIVIAKNIDQPATRSAQAMKAYLEASIPDLKIVEDPRLQLSGRKGQVRMDVPNIISISPTQKDMDREAVLLHEAEHSRVGKAVQGMPEREQFDNDIRFDRLYGDKGNTRGKIVKSFVDNKDKIEKFFGVNIPDVYFEKLMYKNQSRFGSPGALFEEQIATLSALEQLTNKSLTKGMPELFPDDKSAAIYDAITGLRQTRLDAKDLPPFTPQYKSGLDWIKEKLKSLTK